MGLKALNVWVVIAPNDGPQPYASDGSRIGVVKTFGRGFHLPNGMKVPLEIHAGDVVHYFGEERPIGESGLVGIRYENIICVETENAEDSRGTNRPLQVDAGCDGAR